MQCDFVIIYVFVYPMIMYINVCLDLLLSVIFKVYHLRILSMLWNNIYYKRQSERDTIMSMLKSYLYYNKCFKYHAERYYQLSNFKQILYH